MSIVPNREDMEPAMSETTKPDAGLREELAEMRVATIAAIGLFPRVEIDPGMLLGLIDSLAELATLRSSLAQERDCGQDGVCALAPGCNRHWKERNQELVDARTQAERERDEAKTSAGWWGRAAAQVTSERDAAMVLAKVLEEALTVQLRRCYLCAGVGFRVARHHEYHCAAFAEAAPSETECSCAPTERRFRCECASLRAALATPPPDRFVVCETRGPDSEAVHTGTWKATDSISVDASSQATADEIGIVDLRDCTVRSGTIGQAHALAVALLSAEAWQRAAARKAEGGK